MSNPFWQGSNCLVAGPPKPDVLTSHYCALKLVLFSNIGTPVFRSAISNDCDAIDRCPGRLKRGQTPGDVVPVIVSYDYNSEHGLASFPFNWDDFVKRHNRRLYRMVNGEGRSSSALVYVVVPGDVPAWTPGPLAMPIPESAKQAGWATADAADLRTRSAYFHPGIPRVLYGTPATPPIRWSTFTNVQLGGVAVSGLEVMTVPTLKTHRALFILHVQLADSHVVADLERLTRIKADATDTLAASFAALLPVGWKLAPEHRRAISVTFCTEEFCQSDKPPEPKSAGLSAHQIHLWTIASATPLGSFTPTEQTFAQGRLIELSTSWSCLVLRDGIGFIMRSADDPFADMARTLVHSVYLDVVLLVRIQLLIVFDILRALADRGLSRGSAGALIALERYLFDYRRTVWWTTVGEHGNANMLLTAAQEVHALPAQVETLISDVSDASRLAQSIGTARTGSALAVISLIGVPLTAAFAGASLLPWHGWIPLLAATGVALVLSVALATLTPLRELLQGWRDSD